MTRKQMDLFEKSFKSSAISYVSLHKDDNIVKFFSDKIQYSDNVNLPVMMEIVI